MQFITNVTNNECIVRVNSDKTYVIKNWYDEYYICEQGSQEEIAYARTVGEAIGLIVDFEVKHHEIS